ncbi:MAG: sialidase [Gemmatimonadetes bacterium RBG_16_66_8]|nr:MAG: sialidase [Gemmatimonadetes bacterium RBG_16_66_8]
MIRRTRHFTILTSVTTAAWLLVWTTPALAQRRAQAPQAPALALDTALYSQFKWRHIGPEGNRVSAVAGVPGDPQTYYAGAASGGIWKTVDGGTRWQPIFDSQPVQSIGALTVAPSDPSTVWAGTGEPFIRSNISIGWGVYRSTDAGKTWTRMGLENTGRISRIVIDPRNADVVFVCSEGHNYGPQPDRGVFRSTDGGHTWTKTLFVSENAGCSDLVMDPNNPRILFAGTWQLEIRTWGRESGGPGSGVHKSTDGGVTWTALEGNGLPKKPYGKVALAMSAANSNRVYALIEVGDGVPMKGEDTQLGRLWRSDDGGGTWQRVSTDRQLAGRTHYYNRMAAMPDNADEAYFLTASWAKTLDGGKTIIDPPFTEVPGGDHHDIWIDPADADRMIVSHDIGLSITEVRGRSWRDVQLPIAQMYHVTVDTRIPYYVYGNRQDGPSARGPSNSRIQGFFGDGGIPRGMWHSVGGGESGWATPDPEDPNIIWSSASGYGSVGGIVSRYDVRTGIARSVEIWPRATIGWAAADLKYRFVWTFPLTISPHDRNKVYVGSQYVHATTDGGVTWREISPDLTLNDKSRQQISGGLTPDNIGVEYAGVVFAIAESRLKSGLIWAGTNDGQVHVTQNGGGIWTNVTANVAGLPPWGTISNIEPSRYDTATAYMTVDFHQVNNRDPFVYKTTDYGRTWKKIVNGIPASPLSYAHYVKEDPARRGLLYLGTENALYVSFNDGEMWQPLQNNLPHAPLHGIAVQEHFDDLVVATYGRGFWILDDITPLRELTPEVTAKDAHFFRPRTAYRFRFVEAPFAAYQDPVAGQNPRYGASLHYWVKTASTDSATITVADAAGKTVRTFKGPQQAGVNRVFWDLQYDPSREARLRRSPLHSDLPVGPDGMPAPGIGRFSRPASPGSYTVKVTVAGQELTQPLTVLKDPNSGGSEAEITAQTELAADVVSDLNATVDMINATENIRAQLATLKSVLAADSSAADIRAAVDSLERKVIAAEEPMFQLKVTGRGQDLLRWPMQLAEQLMYLGQTVTSSDYGPTNPQRQVHQELKAVLRNARAGFDRVVNEDLRSFNELLARRNMQGVIAGSPSVAPVP